jgi:hypothetical protein
MSHWLFLDYKTEGPDGENIIQRWYERQDAQVRAAFDATVTLLAAKPDWRSTRLVKELQRTHIGLTELVIDLKERRPFRHIRPVGIWREEERIFIFLMGCEKSGRIYIPNRAFDTALRYKELFEVGRGTIREHI